MRGKGGKGSSEYWVPSSGFSELRALNFASRASRLSRQSRENLPGGGLDGTKIPLRNRGKTNLIQQCGALSAKPLV